MAFMASLMTNTAIQVFGKKGARMTKPEDFMPEWDEEREARLGQPRQTVQQMKDIMLSVARSKNKEFEREEKIRKRKPIKKEQ